MSSSSLAFDVIFAGGGASGRLAAADPTLKILLPSLLSILRHALIFQQVLEVDVRDLDIHIQPARYYGSLAPPSKVFQYHVAKPSEAPDGRTVVVPAGKCLGGGSSVNFCMYTRGSASDYDDWEKLGNWGSKDLIPLFIKIETYQVEEGRTHGSSGPIKVSRGGLATNVGFHFLEAAKGYDKDRGLTRDVNDFRTCNKYGNLTIMVAKRVRRIVFQGQRAVGVEFADEEDPTKFTTAKAARLVGSPAILERLFLSGIGHKELQKKVDIDVVVDLPGVGENYNIIISFLASDGADTLDDIFHGDADAIKPHVDQWSETGKCLMAHNGVDSGIKIRPDKKDLEEMGPVFQNRWISQFANAPNRPVLWIGPRSAGMNPIAPRRKFFSMTYLSEYPVSVGRVHISSADPNAPLDFETGFLDDPVDAAVLRWGYKHSRELAIRMSSYRGGWTKSHPKFPPGSAAVISEEKGPVSTDAPLETCTMKPKRQGGVVDSSLMFMGFIILKLRTLQPMLGPILTALVMVERPL
ncbi:hypothetical protein C8J56DRAFT_1002928 [Mycena floridula]|nr:hypothetical protein C8J56DRAFT_1002928 [Mycena floridula]